jgi:hypothetical protein
MHLQINANGFIQIWTIPSQTWSRCFDPKLLSDLVLTSDREANFQPHTAPFSPSSNGQDIPLRVLHCGPLWAETLPVRLGGTASGDAVPGGVRHRRVAQCDSTVPREQPSPIKGCSTPVASVPPDAVTLAAVCSYRLEDSVAPRCR